MAKKGGGDEAEQARADEAARQAKIRQGTSRIDQIFKGNFTPEFFDGRQQAYIDYAKPQLDDQKADAEKQLTFSLARAGTLDSSMRGQKASELQKAYDLQLQGVRDQGLSYKTTAMNAAEDARGNLITTLNATGDAEGAANSALTRAQALSQPAAFSPLGGLFANFTSGLGQQYAAERAWQASGGTGVQPNFNLFGGGGSVKVGK